MKSTRKPNPKQERMGNTLHRLLKATTVVVENNDRQRPWDTQFVKEEIKQS